MKTFSSVLILVLALVAYDCPSQTYQLTDLGVWVGTNSYAQGINNQSQVVGYWNTPAGAHAFLYQAGAVTDLGLLGMVATNSYALSINNQGQVVGFSETTNGSRAFLYRDRSITNLGDWYGLESYAYGISGDGHIIGYVDTPTGTRASLYYNGNVVGLGTLGGTNSMAFGVNDALQVVGSSLTTSNATTHAFLWQNGSMLDLNQVLPFNSGWELVEARGINESGQIVGWGQINNQQRAFLYKSGNVEDLGLLSGGTNSYAFGMNNSNSIVGTASSASGEHAFLWQNGFINDLNDLINLESGWELREAWGINDFGQIVGWGVVSGQAHAFLLTPPTTTASTGGKFLVSQGQTLAIIPLASSPPTVSITNPVNNASFAAPTNLTIKATASDSDGTVTQVQFLVGSRVLGVKTKSPYSVTWSNAPVGIHALTAIATDKTGLTGTSSVVNVSISTNLLPIADAHVRDGSSTNANFGTNIVMECLTTNDSSNNRDIYFKFDLSNVSSNISSAQLKVFAKLGSTNSISNTVYSVTNTSWLETNITWNNKPAWVTALTTNSVTGTNWYLFDVSSYVKSQKTNGQNVVSLALHDPTNYSLLISINSKENSANRPSLVIVTTNSPLSVSLTNPANNTIFPASANIAIRASAADSDGTVTQVQFFKGTNSLGISTSVPYGITWSNATSGTYALTAVARDNGGLVATSGVINVTVDTLPSVTLTNPANNAVFAAGSNINLGASASDADGTVTRVQFFRGTNSLGTATNSPYGVTWTNAASGAYALTVVANDNNGMTTTSSVVNVTVDSLPSVTITNPVNNASFAAPTNLTIKATASDSDGTVTQVQFLVGTRLLGVKTNTPYSVTWSNAPVGTHALTAIATDNTGLTGISSVVNVNISTNLLPIADAHIRDGSSTNANFGTNIVMECLTTNDSSNNRDIYFKFDLTGVSNISSARLSVFAKLGGSGSVSNTVYSVTNTSWVETNITWNNKPARVTALTTNTMTGTTGSWYLFDVTSYVKSPKAAGQNVISLALHDPTNYTRLISINSKENSTNKPSLVLVTTNSPLSVSLTNPVNNTIFPAPANISIGASAFDSDGTITQVQFFQGTNSLGVVTNSPYGITWSNVTSGTYALTAVARDNGGLVATSGVINVIVDTLPSVTLTNPANNAFFVTGSNIALGASASDADGTIAQVQFFQENSSLGTVTASPFTLTWTNPAAGTYALTACATDNNGLVTTSVVVNVAIQAPILGMVAWWQAEGNTLDSAGTNNGTLQGGAGFTNGMVGQAFYFNGIDGDVQIADSPSLKPTNITVEGWVRLDAQSTPNASATGLQYMVFKKNTRGGNFEGYTLVKNRVSGQDVFGFAIASPDGQQVGVNSTTAPQVGVWYHVAGIYDSGSGYLNIYVNGAMEGSAYAGFPLDYGTRPIFIGTTGESWDGRLQGSVDEVSIYNRALSWNEIAAIYYAGSNGKIPSFWVTLINPANNALILAGSNLGLGAQASDPTGAVTQVEFFQGTNSLGIVTNSPYGLVWTNLPTGTYALTARATDDHGLVVTSAVVNVSVRTLLSDMLSWWRAEGNALDSVGINHGISMGGVTYASGEVGQAFNFDGTSRFIATSLQTNNPQNFSLELWFKTTTTQGGVLMGFGNSQFNTSGGYDRNLYMDNNGRLHFGIWNSGTQMADSTASYNDGSWHHAAVTVSGAAGSALYVDGVLVASNQLATTAQNLNGWWRIGQNNLSGWPSGPSSFYFNGLIDEVSIYDRPLSAADIQFIYNAGSTGKAPNLSVTLTNPANNALLAPGSNVSLGAATSDTRGTVTQVQFFFGTHCLGTVTDSPYSLIWTNPVVGTYSVTAQATDNNGLATTSAAAIFYVTPLTNMVAWWRAEGNALDSVGINHGIPMGGVTYASGEVGQAFNVDGSSGFIATSFQVTTPQNFTLELWIKTTTTRGGALMGFGDSQFNSPANYDRVLYMDNNGRLHWGVYSLGTKVADSAASYNDGSWHHVAATLSSSVGSALYMDGVLVATNQLATPAANYNGWWRIGENNLGGWPSGPSSYYFSGLIDEVSIYNRALSSNEIAAIYFAGSAGKIPIFSVTLTNPVNNAVVPPGSNISLGASASDPNGTVTQMQFFQGTNSLGVATIAPYSLVWTNPAIGTYALTARATDNNGFVVTSLVVNVVVDTPPGVTLTNPANSSVFVAGSNVSLGASASAAGGTVTQVQFFQGTNSLGVVTTAPYNLVWANPPSGTYSLTAQATDNYGLTSTSAVVNLIVDAPPTVSITSPANGSVLAGPINVTLMATAGDSDGTVTQVQFFQRTTSLGTAANSPYSLVWSNAAVGSYALTAVAVDNHGISTTSSVVNVTIAPLVVSITSPANNTVLSASSNNVTVTAIATDILGTVTQIQFFQGMTSLGVATSSPYGLVWSNVPSGNYALTAVATDDNGLMATSSIVNIYITSLFGTNNLKFWLSADALAGLGNGASVGTWPDQSGWNNNAYQNNSGNQPLYLTNLLNGHSVVRFNGANSCLNLPAFMNGATQGEAFVVLKATSIPGSLWSLGSYGVNVGAGIPPPLYPDVDGSITEDFGSANIYHLGVPAQPLNQYHVYEVSSQTNNWAAWINGQLLYQTFNNPVGFANSPLSFGRNFFCFGGDVAEVLVFNRVLSAGERGTVNNYLNGRYDLVPPVPLAPTGLVAAAISPTQISLNWIEPLNGAATQISIERATSSNGVFSVVAQVNNTLSYLDTNLTANTTYYYRVRAINLQTWSAYSSVAQATTPGTGSDLPLNNVRIWLKADAGLLQGTTNTPVNLWVDQSGNGNNASQVAAANRPTWVPEALNGRPVVRFNGANSCLNLPAFMNGATQGEAFVVLKATHIPGSLWSLGSYGVNVGAGIPPPLYPDVDGSITEDFGSANIYHLGVPTQPLNQYHVYEVSSQTNNWAAWINGQLLYQTFNNPVGFANSPLSFGRNFFCFGGDVAEVLVFNRGLTADERLTVHGYLDGKYGLDMATPPTPTNLVATAISSTQIGLSWNEPPNNATQISIERATSSNGVFSVVAQVSNTLAYLDVNLTPGTTYYYRGRAINHTQFQVPYSGYSGVAQATTRTNGLTMPFDSLALWLRADLGVLTNTSGQISVWADQSGGGNNASQTTTNAQPVWVSTALNGCPVVHFNGAHSFLSLPNFLEGAASAEAFVVLKVTGTNAIRSLWEFGGDIYDPKTYPDTDGTIRDDFGSTVVHPVGVPTQPLTEYHVYEVSSQPYDWLAWINGGLMYELSETDNNVVDFSAGLCIGHASYLYDNGYVVYLADSYFNGEIAEMLVFNRALTTGERGTINYYLNAKYGLVPPMVAITSPANNAVLPGPANISITATAGDSAGIKQVQFFSGTTSLGLVTNAPYSLVWSNVALGDYALTARATDNNGLIATSTVVNVTVAGIAITSPSNNTILTAPANIPIRATVADGAGISQVEFFSGATSLGVATNVPYNLAWNNVSSGAYALTAVATDNYGQTLTSSVVNVTVDVPLTVTLTNPADGARFVAGTNISLAASASDADGTVAQVEFFSGATSLGVATSAPYSLIWINVPSGACALTARATDSSGLVSTSAVVNIMVAGIALTSPANNVVFTVPASVTISAAVTDNVGISQVQFFQGATSLGIVTGAPYSLVWTNVTSGVYALTAVATDSGGLVFTSGVVNVIVDADPGNTDRDGDGVSDYLEYLQGRNPLVNGSVSDTNGIINLQIYTPLH